VSVASNLIDLVEETNIRDLVSAALDLTDEELRLFEGWVQDVDVKWKPPKGLSREDAMTITKVLSKASDKLPQATSKLNFFVNRAGYKLASRTFRRMQRVFTLLPKSSKFARQRDKIEKEIEKQLARRQKDKEKYRAKLDREKEKQRSDRERRREQERKTREKEQERLKKMKETP